MKRIYFTVTNDLIYDQRMHRICTSLANAGFDVVLVGRKLKHSLELDQKPFRQKRIRCLFNKGFLFYGEYNLRLFFYLLTQKMDGVCAIDLDTILPCFLVSRIKRIARIYDAHEYFTELKEVRTRPRVQKIWTAIEKFTVPAFQWGYTVSRGLADEFYTRYQRNYLVIRNLPVFIPDQPSEDHQRRFILYQGAVNEARGFEYLVPAMKEIPYPLVICGDGNFMEQLKALVKLHGVEDKVEFRGMLLPGELRAIALKASLGIGLAEKEGINQFMALPNKFLEYMHAGLPQVAMAFPEYQRINDHYRIAILIDSLEPKLIAETINRAMDDLDLLSLLRANALRAREEYCWQNEEKKLIEFYKSIFRI